MDTGTVGSQSPVEPGLVGLRAVDTRTHSPITASVVVRRAGRVGAALVRTAGAVTWAVLRGSPDPRSQRVAGAVARSIPQFGPAAVKFSQLLATRRDLVPATLCDQLELLWGDQPDDLDARDAQAAADRLRTLWPPARSGELRLVGSGSIAYVFHVRLPDGTELAAKVVKATVRENLQLDMAAMRAAATAIQALPPARGIPVKKMVDHLCAAVEAQTDLIAEGRNLRELGEAFVGMSNVRVPRYREDQSTAEVLLMDWIAADLTPVADAADRAEQIMVLVYEMLFTHGLVHVDLHPGNLQTAGHEIVVYDAGFVMRVDAATQRSLGMFFLGLAVGDGAACARAVVDSCEDVPLDLDEKGFDEAMQGIVDANTGARSSDFNVVRFSGDLFEIQRKFKIHPNASFVFPLMALATVEGRVRELDPHLDFQSLSIPFVSAAMERPTG